MWPLPRWWGVGYPSSLGRVLPTEHGPQPSQQMFNAASHISAHSIEEQARHLKMSQVYVSKKQASAFLTAESPRVAGISRHRVFAVNKITLQDQKIVQVLVGQLAVDEGKMVLGHALLSGLFGSLWRRWHGGIFRRFGQISIEPTAQGQHVRFDHE